MALGCVWLKDNTYELIQNNNDFKKLIEEKIEIDAAKYIDELIKAADYNTSYVNKKIQTDLAAYESESDNYNCMFDDIQDNITEIKNHITNDKRINRDEIFQKIIQIEKILNNR